MSLTLAEITPVVGWKRGCNVRRQRRGRARLTAKLVKDDDQCLSGGRPLRGHSSFMWRIDLLELRLAAA